MNNNNHISGPISGPNPSPISGPNPIPNHRLRHYELQNRRITSLDNLIYDYNRNMRFYQQNIQDIVEIIGSIQSTVGPTNRASNSIFHQHSQPPIRDIFSLFFQPYTNSDVNESSILTDDQINSGTETLIFTENMRSLQEEDNRCPIIMEAFLVNDELLRIKGCHHKFKKNALMNWFQQSTKCPMCRYDLLNYNSSTINSSTISEPLPVNPYTIPLESSLPQEPGLPQEPVSQVQPPAALWENLLHTVINSQEVRNRFETPQMQTLTHLFSEFIQFDGSMNQFR